MRVFSTASLVTLSACLVTACGAGGNPLLSGPTSGQLTVGSANFPENVLLADIYASALKAKGFKIATKFNVGSREILYQQAANGTISVLPEYNGALLAFLDPTAAETTTEGVNAALKARLPPQLAILNSSAAQDKNAIAVTGETATRDNLASIGDLSPYASRMEIGGPPEFKTRKEGLPGLQDKYGLTFKGFQPLDTAGPITVRALKDGSVQVATLLTTDPNVAVNGFKLLDDPKHVFGAQNVTPLTYRASIDATAATTLDAISAKLDTTALASIMQQVMIEKRDIDVVGDAWLKSVGLL